MKKESDRTKNSSGFIYESANIELRVLIKHKEIKSYFKLFILKLLCSTLKIEQNIIPYPLFQNFEGDYCDAYHDSIIICNDECILYVEKVE